MRLGKLTSSELERLVLSKIGVSRPEAVLSAAVGEDCAAIRADGFILLSSDPITVKMPPETLGGLCVYVACNDIACNGGEPIALLLTLIIPAAAEDPEGVIDKIMTAAAAAAKRVRVDIVGGHTEFSDAVTRPLVCATAVGKTARLLKKTGLAEGDGLFITKRAGIEGAMLLEGGIILDESLSVIPECAVLRQIQSVTAMHDVTEGGVLGAAAELCEGANRGAVIYQSAVPVPPRTANLCRKNGIDPLRLISSGALLFTASDDAPVSALGAAGIPCARIGEITADGGVILVRTDGGREQIFTEADGLFKAKGGVAL
ncbi:MAG: AIR synthase [Clostridiales bacterium]|jgi:hydrogenase maturation factor|nr:AIR synthase [Clostridiales bacterium]